MKSDTFLIIGSNSFSGSSFINHLLNKDFKVIGISRGPEKKTLNPYKSNKNLKFRNMLGKSDRSSLFISNTMKLSYLLANSLTTPLTILLLPLPLTPHKRA